MLLTIKMHYLYLRFNLSIKGSEPIASMPIRFPREILPSISQPVAYSFVVYGCDPRCFPEFSLNIHKISLWGQEFQPKVQSSGLLVLYRKPSDMVM